MTNYTNNLQRTPVRTPQSQKASKDQVANNAGGFTFKVDCWTRLDRFVVLGSDKNSYYVGQREQTEDNYESLTECIAEDGLRTVNTIVEISRAGRAPRNASAVFSLAVCAASGDKITKEAAFRNMPGVARTATDFFSFINDYKALGGGFGTVARKGIEGWYQAKEISSAAYQMIKYRQRDGWTHLDALRLAHVKPRNEAESNLYAFAKTLAGKTADYKIELLPDIAQGYLSAQTASKASEIVGLINDLNLPREAIPTQFLNDANVWDALLQRMPATALIRNLGKMTSIGVIDANSAGAKLVEEKLADGEWLRNSRLHPITILNAMAVYGRGEGIRGSLTWNPSRRVVDALDGAFYNAFDNIEPTGKRFMLALDVSGSMGGGYGFGYAHGANSFALSAREISAAMSMATAKVEDDYVVIGFSDGTRELGISPRQRLDDVVKTISNLPFDRTDCAQPMLHALKHKQVIDTFVIYTDNETWFGRVHPFEALKDYRRKVNPEAKLIVCATESTMNSIADPTDAGMMDIVGFDSSVPEIISDFARG